MLQNSPMVVLACLSLKCRRVGRWGFGGGDHPKVLVQGGHVAFRVKRWMTTHCRPKCQPWQPRSLGPSSWEPAKRQIALILLSGREKEKKRIVVERTPFPVSAATIPYSCAKRLIPSKPKTKNVTARPDQTRATHIYSIATFLASQLIPFIVSSCQVLLTECQP